MLVQVGSLCVCVRACVCRDDLAGCGTHSGPGLIVCQERLPNWRQVNQVVWPGTRAPAWLAVNDATVAGHGTRKARIEIRETDAMEIYSQINSAPLPR